MAIRWRKQDITKLSDYVRKFNAAITRREKQYEQNLPEKLNAKSLRKTITERSSFNALIKSVDKFLNPKPTTTGMRWRPQDEKKLSIYVRKFNTALSREAKLFPEKAKLLPERMNVQELRENITSRTQFNKTLASIDRFFAKGARDIVQSPLGAPTLRWFNREMRYAKQSLKAKATYKRKALESLLKDKPGAESMVEAFTEPDITAKIKELQDRIARLGEGADPDRAWKNFLYRLTTQASIDAAQRDADYLRKFYEGYTTELGAAQTAELKKLMEKYKVTPRELAIVSIYDDNLSLHYVYGEDEKAERHQYFLSELIPTVLAIRSALT